MQLEPGMTMETLARTAPGARRALFRAYHIGGCASCGFRPDETLADVCARNGGLDPHQVIETITAAHEQEVAMQLSPGETARMRQEQPGNVRLLDIRTREEFDAVHIPGSVHFTQEMLQEILGSWPREQGVMVLVDHQGDRALDAAAYFAGHGFQNVKALRGGIDAWSATVDPGLPRYELELA